MVQCNFPLPPWKMIVRVRCRNVYFFLHNLSLEVNRSPGLFPLTLFHLPFFSLEAWSNDGCKVGKTGKSETVCECTHFSTFALIMSVKEKVGESHHIMIKPYNIPYTCVHTLIWYRSYTLTSLALSKSNSCSKGKNWLLIMNRPSFNSPFKLSNTVIFHRKRVFSCWQVSSNNLKVMLIALK